MIGYVRRHQSPARTGTQTHAAALRLQRGDAPWQDLRLPITAALLDTYPALSDHELVALVEAMLPIEERELRGAASVQSDRAASRA